jgi:polyhydroxybutyrate depolymerase
MMSLLNASAVLAGCFATLPPRAAQAGVMAPCAPGPEITRAETIRVDGMTREYSMHIPARNNASRLPLLFAFHGRGESPEQIRKYSGLSRLSAVLVYPRGLPGRGGKLSWSGTPGATSGADDIRFVNATLSHLEEKLCVDPSRVYATGKSDGGGLAMQLACEDADRFRGAVSIAGAYYPISGGCRPIKPVSILEMHGTGDRVIPYEGSRQRRLPPIHRWLMGWAQRDGCGSAHHASLVANGIKHDVWTACPAGIHVEGYRIDGGGHTWPGALTRQLIARFIL